MRTVASRMGRSCWLAALICLGGQTLIGQVVLRPVSGMGQLVLTGSPSAPLVVELTNNGSPVPNAEVRWSILPIGINATLSTAAIATNAAGQAQTNVNFYFVPSSLAFRALTVRAELASDSSRFAHFTVTYANVDFTGTVLLVSGELASPQPGQLPVSAKSGTQGTVPIRIRVFSTTGPVPDVRLQIEDVDPRESTPQIRCTESAILTDAQGVATCTPVFSGPPGDGNFTIIVGGGSGLIGFPLQSFRVLPSTAPAGPAFSCFANAAVPPLVRAEGISELTGDILLNCTGGTPTAAGQPIPGVNIQIFLNTPVTSKIVSGTSLTEALLLLDDPGPQNPQNPQQTPCLSSVCLNIGNGTGQGYYDGQVTGIGNRNVFQGQTVAGNPNSLVWIGVPIDPPGPYVTRVIRITNVRAYAAQFGGGANAIPTTIQALISASGTFSVPINNPLQTVALVQNGLAFSMTNAPTTLQQCFSQTLTRVGTLRYAELFATAFKKYNSASSEANPRASAAQNTFHAGFNTETGFYNPQLPAANGLNVAGLPTSGTRLRAVFANVPAGVTLYVSPRSTNTGGDMARLTASETGEFSAVSGNPAEVAGGVAIWEITESDPATFSTVTFDVYASYTAPSALGTGTVQGSFAPVSTTVAASPGPIPRFVDRSTASNLLTVNPCLTNLLFPFVTAQAGFDTGIAISNTSEDPFGTSVQGGTCTLNWYGTNEIAATVTPTVEAGGSWTGLVSSLVPSFQGYVIAQCRFQFGHGFAFVTKVGAIDLAMGYLALIIPDPARSPRPAVCSGGSTIAGCVSSGEQLAP